MTTFHQTYKQIRIMPRAFWVIIIATFINQTGNMALVFLMLYATQSLQFSLTEASYLFAAVSSGTLLGGLFGGHMADRYGAARVTIIAISMNGLSLLILRFAHTFWPMFGLCLLWGFAYGLYRPASQTFVSYLSSAGIHRITFSVYRLAINLGMSIGPAIGGYLAAHSFNAIFLANAIANLLAGSILALGLKNSPWLTSHTRIPTESSTHRSTWLIRDRALYFFILAIIPISMIFFQHESTLPIFLHRDLGLSLSFYGSLFTINTLMIVFFELPLNVMTLSWPYRVNFIIGSLLMTIGFAGFALATQAWHVIALTVLWTLGEMILFPASSSYIASLAPTTKRGAYMGFYTTGTNLGLLLGPWAGALVMTHLGMIDLWIACGVWGCLSLFLFSKTKEPVPAM